MRYWLALVLFLGIAAVVLTMDNETASGTAHVPLDKEVEKEDKEKRMEEKKNELAACSLITVGLQLDYGVAGQFKY